MKIYGYVRVSSDLQNCANQHYEIETFCKKNHLVIDEWVEEVISSKKILKERKLGKLLSKLKKRRYFNHNGNITPWTKYVGSYGYLTTLFRKRLPSLDH